MFLLYALILKQIFLFPPLLSWKLFFSIYLYSIIYIRFIIYKPLIKELHFLAEWFTTRESFIDRRNISAMKKYTLRAMIVLTTFIQLRDKTCTRVVNWKTGNSRSRETQDRFSIIFSTTFYSFCSKEICKNSIY